MLQFSTMTDKNESIEKCPNCDQTKSSSDSNHNCIKFLSTKLADIELIVKDNESLIASQNILIAKLIADNETNKQQLADFDTIRSQLTSFRSDLDELKDDHQMNGTGSRHIVTNDNGGQLVQHQRPRVSRKHEQLILNLKESLIKDENLTISDKVLNVMLSVDFRDFEPGQAYLNLK